MSRLIDENTEIDKRTQIGNLLELINNTETSLDLLKDEMKIEHFSRSDQVEIDYYKTKQEFSDFKDEEIAAAHFFKQSDYKNKMKQLFHEENVDNLFSKNRIYISSLYRAFKRLPFFYGSVFTGMSLKSENLSAYGHGEIILWTSFVDASKDNSIYLKSSEINFIFEIVNSRVKDFSNISKMEHYVFLPFTYFEVIEVKSEENRYFIKLSEIGIENFANNKTILWIDDYPQNNLPVIKYILNNKYNSNIKMFRSTDVALAYLADNETILKNKLDHLRIVSDVARFEDGVLNSEAGINLIKTLRLEYFGYQEKILLYSGLSSYKKLKQRQDIDDLNIICTHDVQVCLGFLLFVDNYTKPGNIFLEKRETQNN